MSLALKTTKSQESEDAYMPTVASAGNNGKPQPIKFMRTFDAV
jgi:hypothetical protein